MTYVEFSYVIFYRICTFYVLGRRFKLNLQTYKIKQNIRTTFIRSWGIGVLLGVVVSGGVSGGHLNPAVSVAVATLGKFPWWKVCYN
jgi:glycerol uptake facilitator-like aquaporin